MSKSISSEIVDKITSQISIIDVISHYLSLTKKGNNYIGLCPFHQDSNPSFTVSESKKIYKCFACGESGNMITFLIKKENKSYLQALQKIAEIGGLDVDFSSYNQQNQKNYNPIDSEILEILKAANNFYRLQVLKNNNVKNYLTQRNIFDNEILGHFNIGYAPLANELINYLIERLNYPMEKLLQAGLINAEGNELLRNRLVFAIKNQYGEIVGFSGRSLSESNAKYINSPESALFDKSAILYNYSDAKDFIEANKEIIIVEGYMDVIACYRANIKNVVAIMGTALTSKHLSLLYGKKIKIFLDNDNAGITATLKTVKTLLANSFQSIQIVINPYQKDADETLNEQGVKALQKVINTTKDAIDFIYNVLINNYKIDKNSDFAAIKEFAKEFELYLRYYPQETQNYFINKIKNEFNYELIISYLHHKLLFDNKNNAQIINENNFANDIYGDWKLVQEDYHLQNKKNEFWDTISHYKRFKVLVFLLLRNDFAQLFYQKQGIDILFSQPSELRDLYKEIKLFNLEITKNIQQAIFDSITEAYENIEVETKIKVFKKQLQDLFINISKYQNNSDLSTYFNEYFNQCQQQIDQSFLQAKHNKVEFKLLPYIREAGKANQDFYIKNKIHNSQKINDFNENLNQLKKESIKIEKR
ncbi:DNA primase [Mycoplasmopsis mustelae]|uniref:DNA primase n=1 Tax=Mycoplasmopsis mustelae TaxID=171289 RepID=A0A4R7UF90_9BACT|nr:DNA primase [Mycoplasmopsis mustelae]TDV24344.1 DNA primase [Mycoplasmopsis mustelae]